MWGNDRSGSKVTLNRMVLGITLMVTFCMSVAVHANTVITGTYSNFTFNPEAGDLNGTEIRFVMTKKGMKGIVQFAEGGAGDVFIVDVMESGGRIHFELPIESGFEGNFDGVLLKRALRGTFVFKTGAKEEVSLPRRPSYWDR